MTTNIGSIPVDEKLDWTNFDIWSLKIQFLLNNGDILELLMATMSASVGTDERGKDVIASEEYQEELKAYQPSLKGSVSTLHSAVVYEWWSTWRVWALYHY